VLNKRLRAFISQTARAAYDGQKKAVYQNSWFQPKL